MKKAFSFIFMLIFTLSIFAQGYVINGLLYKTGRGVATLRVYFKDGNEKIDTSAIEKDGKFYFRGMISEDVPALLTINGKKSYRLYLSPGSTIDITMGHSKEKKNGIKGSPLTDSWYSIVNPQGKEDYDVHLERLENWVINNPENIFCADIIASYLAHKWNYEELSRTLNTLKGEATNTYHYRHLKERLKQMNSLQIGATAPDFAAVDMQGKNQRMSSLARQSKYTLLVFWASWSKESREIGPTLIQAYNRFKNKGFNIVSLSIDEDKNSWKQAVETDKTEWTQLFGGKKWESEAAKAYMLKAVPYNVLIDQDNKIVEFNIRAENLADRLAELTGNRGFRVEGEIAPLEEGTIVMELLKADGQKEKMATKIVNGRFVFEGEVDKVCMATLVLPTRSGEVSFFLENSFIEIDGELKDLDKVQISGSRSNDDFLQIANRCNRQKNPMQCLMNYVLDNPQSIYAPLIVSSYLAPYLNTNELREVFSKLSGEATQMYQYQLLKNHIAELDKDEALGEKVKDFTLSDINGKPVSLSNFVSQNQYTLIHFWASWDLKSTQGIKDLRLLYNKYKTEGFNIISISLDDERAAWADAIKRYAMQWTNVSDLKRWNSTLVKIYNLEYIPQNILVDKNGRIVAKNLSCEDLNQRLLLKFAK